MIAAITTHADPIPGLLPFVDGLRKRHIKIGSCTGYTAPMMAVLVPEAAKRGYSPDCAVCSSDVPAGRPFPWMCYQNAIRLQVFPLESMVKIGDTICTRESPKALPRIRRAVPDTALLLVGGGPHRQPREVLPRRLVAHADPVGVRHRVRQGAEQLAVHRLSQRVQQGEDGHREPRAHLARRPLGLGGLLVDAWRVQQLMQQGANPGVPLLDRLLDGALTGLRYYARSGELQRPAGYRLAFRELGLAIGLHALERMQQSVEQGEQPTQADPKLLARLQELKAYLPLREAIEDFWRDPANRQGETWNEHRDINEVMLATGLAPDGCLTLTSPD